MYKRQIVIIFQIEAYAINLKSRRIGTDIGNDINITWYVDLNDGLAVSYEDFDKLIDESIADRYNQLNTFVLNDIFKVKAICSELSYIEPWLMDFKSSNYKDIDEYLSESKK